MHAKLSLTEPFVFSEHYISPVLSIENQEHREILYQPVPHLYGFMEMYSFSTE